MEKEVLKPLLDLREMASILGVSPAHLHRMTHNGDVPFVEVTLGKQRRSFRYDPQDVISHLKTRSERERISA